VLAGALVALCVLLLTSGPAAWAAGDASLDASIVPQPMPGWVPAVVPPAAMASLESETSQIGIIGGGRIALRVWRSPVGGTALEIMLVHLPELTPQVSNFPQAFADGACLVPPKGGNAILLVPLAEPAGAFSASCTLPSSSMSENMLVVEAKSTFVGVVSIGTSPLPGSELVSIGAAQVARLPVPPPPYGLIAAVAGVLWVAAFVVGLLVRREPSVLAALLIVLLTGLVGLPLYLLGVRAGRAIARRGRRAPVGGFGLALAGGQPGPWTPAPVAHVATPGIAPVAAPYDPARFERQQVTQEHPPANGALPPLGGAPAQGPTSASHASSESLPPLGGIVAPAYGGGLAPLGGIVAPAHTGALPPLGGAGSRVAGAGVAGGAGPAAGIGTRPRNEPPAPIAGGLPPLGALGASVSLAGTPVPMPVAAPAPVPPTPMPSAPAGPAPGWYPDEREPGAQIYWDGAAWGTRIRWDGNAWIPIAP
jgi:hypothetical protein